MWQRNGERCGKSPLAQTGRTHCSLHRWLQETFIDMIVPPFGLRRRLAPIAGATRRREKVCQPETRDRCKSPQSAGFKKSCTRVSTDSTSRKSPRSRPCNFATVDYALLRIVNIGQEHRKGAKECQK